MKSYKRLFLHLALTLVLLPVATLSAQAEQPLDRIVAVINDGVITERQLIEETRVVARQVGLRQDRGAEFRALSRQVLDRMISNRVQLERAEKLGIRVDDTTLEQTITGIARNNGLTLPQLQETLAREGISFAAYREQIREEIILNQLHQREIYERVQVSEREIDEYMETFSGSGGNNEEYRLQQILVSVPENARPEQVSEARERVTAILDELSDKPFEQVSAERSDAPNALDGGDLGWRDLSRVPTLFVEVVRTLEPGQVSEPIRSPNGFHILKLADRRQAGGPVQIVESRIRHVLVQPNETKSEEQARQEAESLRQRVTDGAPFADVAAEASDDRGSAARGGDLGWVKPGVMVEEFQQMATRTAVGEISPVFRSQFGWHFLQVEDRREVEVPEEQLRADARQAIGERKAEEDLLSWIRRQRAEAYVEVRL
ncbi:MAG: peptidylprolyl isomerase [Halothiobacillaceae bacterium]